MILEAYLHVPHKIYKWKLERCELKHKIMGHIIYLQEDLHPVYREKKENLKNIILENLKAE